MAVAVAALITAAASTAHAQTWVGDTSQDYNDATNWEGDAFPAGINASINVDTAGAFPILDATPTFTPVDIFVGSGNGNAGRLDQTSGTLSTGAGNWMFVGQEGGTGTYNLGGDGSLTAGALNIGAWGGNGANGTVNVDTTGTVTLDSGAGRPFGFGDASLLVGENAGTGTLNLDNGTINSAFTTRFGHGNSTGNLNMTGGALNTTGELMIASTGDGIATVEHSGGTNSTTTFFSIGRNGTGTYNLSGTGIVNAATDSGNAVVGNFAGATGELNITGGTFNVGDADTASNFLIGENGTATVNIIGNNANVSVMGNLLLGLDAAGGDTGAVGTLNFVADASGFTPFTVGGSVNLSSPDGDFLTVDISSYTGAFSNITLIDGVTNAGEFTGLFQGDSVGTDFNGNEYFIDYGTISEGDIILSTTAIILNQWDVDGGGSFNTASNWTDNVVPTDTALFAGALTADNAPAVITVDSAASVDSVRFSNANDYILAGNAALTLTGAAQVNVVSGRHWNRGELAGTNGLNVSGAGEFVLDGNNSFSGGLTANDATVSVTSADAIPAGNDIAVSNSGVVQFFGEENGFFGNGNPLDDPTDPGNGTGVATGLDPNSTLAIGGNVSIDETSSVIVHDGANVAFSGVISGAGNVTVNSGSTVAVSGTNTYSGVTTVNGGTLTVSNAAALGAGDGTAATQTVIGGNDNDGTLALSGGITVANELLQFNAREGDAVEAVGLSSTGNNAWNGNIRGDLGGTQYNIESTSGTLTIGGTFSAPDTGTRDFVFSGDGNFNITGRITDAAVDADGNIIGPSTADNVNVTKRGSGTMTVAAATDINNDLWFGNTTVEGGTLVLTANAGSTNELFSAVTTVRAGATLNISSFGAGGDGIYDVGIADELAGGGTYNIGSGTIGLFDDNILTPGDGVGTMSVTGNVSLSPDVGGGAFNYQLGNTTAIGGSENDLISISGSLTTSGAPSMALNISAVEGTLATGTYRLINHSGGSTSFGSVTPQVIDADGNVLNTRQNLTVSGATAGQVNLSVTGAAANLFWKGTPNNEWSAGGTANFGLNSVAGANSSFFDLDSVTFGSGASSTNVNVTANVAPNTMTVNGGQSYSFSGSDINANSVTVTGGATASFDNSVGGNVTVTSTSTLGGAGTFKNDVAVQSGGTLRIGAATIPLASSLRTTNGDFETGANPPGETQVDLWSDQNTAGPNNDGQFFTQAQHEQGFNPNGTTGVFLGDGDGNVGGALGTGGRWIYQEIGTKDSGDTYTISFDYGNTNDFASTDRTIAVRVEVYQGAFPAAQADPDATDDMDIADQGLTLISSFDSPGTSIPGTDGMASFSGALDVASANTTDPLWVRISNLPGAGVDAGSFLMLDNVFITAAIGSAPGIDAETMTVEGDVSLAAGSTAQFNIGASGISDLLAVGGNLDITDGANLEVLLDASVAASSLGAGDSWDLFDFAAVSGAFDLADISLPALTGNVEWDISNLSVDGTLSIVSLGIGGDFNGDGTVDAADYTVWRDNLGATEDGLVLNGNGDGGTVGTSDYDLWKTNFGLTAGAGSGQSVVPEPGTLALLLVVGCGAFARRRRA